MMKAPKVMPSTAGRTRVLPVQPGAGRLRSALPPPSWPLPGSPILLCWLGAQVLVGVSAQPLP